MARSTALAWCPGSRRTSAYSTRHVDCTSPASQGSHGGGSPKAHGVENLAIDSSAGSCSDLMSDGHCRDTASLPNKATAVAVLRPGGRYSVQRGARVHRRSASASPQARAGHSWSEPQLQPNDEERVQRSSSSCVD